jgi:hypothetical protein
MTSDFPQLIEKGKGNYLTRGVGRKKGSKWGISKGNGRDRYKVHCMHFEMS